VQVLQAKGGKARTVPIPVLIQEEVTELCQGQPPEAVLFPTKRGNKIRQHWIETVFNVAVEKARERDVTMPRVTPHQLRHTYASLAVAAGASVMALSRLLGHSTPTITLNTYSDLFDSDLDAVALAVEEARLRGTNGGAVAGDWRSDDLGGVSPLGDHVL
jgi:integrase